MAENLKVTHWQGGTPIQTTADPNEDIEWWDPEDSRLQWAYNGIEDNAGTYGRLYTYYAIEGDSICPSGWHVPDSMEFDSLFVFLGGSDFAGGKLKSLNLWNNPNTGATNESGFNGLPASSRTRQGSFGDLGRALNMWSFGVRDNILFYESNKAQKYVTSYKQNGYSIRCMKK
jgi:uncharacterized protein (TIGR02145 family)